MPVGLYGWWEDEAAEPVKVGRPYRDRRKQRRRRSGK